MSYLQLKALGKTYSANGRSLEALVGLDLEVEQGEFVALIGPSGCGKTTLLRLVAGLETPSVGHILLAGQEVCTWGRERTLVAQDNTLFPWLSAEENVAFGLRAAGVPVAERLSRARALLAGVGLADFAGHYPAQLSGGMQQRVALARALAVAPKVLLLDEPFAAVDALTREHLQGLLLELWQHRLTILLVTHSVPEALRLADRVVVLSHRPGRVVGQVAIAVPRPRSGGDLAALEPRVQALLAQ